MTRRKGGFDPLPPEEVIRWRITAYFTVADRDRVHAAAEAAGVSVSEFGRRAVLAALDREEAPDALHPNR